MKIAVSCACWLAGFSISVFGQTDLIINGGFEVGIQNEWQITPGEGVDVRANVNFAHTGAGYLKMGEVGFADGIVRQQVTLPTNTIAAVLSYWRNIYCPVVNDGVFGAAILYTNGTVATNIETLAVSGDVDGKGTPFYDLNAIDLTAFAGQTIYVAFELQTGTFGASAYVALDDISLVVGTTADLAANDYFTNRTVLTGNSASVSAKNTFATKEPGEPNHAQNAGGRSVWWSWTAPGDGVLDLNTQNSDPGMVPLLAVYTGTSVSNLTTIKSDDALNEVDGIARVRFPVRANTEYEIAADGYSSGVVISVGTIHLNLTFTPDTTPPKVTISSPAANAKLTDGTVTVKGTASDNVAVDHVEFRLENAAGTNAYQTADGTNSWTATVTDLVPGLNTIRVRAFDTVSNVSPAVTRSVSFVVVSPLNLTIEGGGTVSPNYTGKSLEVGKSYTLTAKPASGNVFSNWVGDLTSSNPKLTFVMQSNMTLQANFIPNPFTPVQGTYAGLFYSTNGVTTTNAGFFSARLTDKGAFTAKVIMPSGTLSVSGKVGVDGSISNSIPRRGSTPLQFHGQVDLNGGNMITGEFSDGVQTSELTANRAVFSRTSPPPQAGRKYTVTLPGSDDASVAPGGFSFGSTAVDASGNISLAGVMGDGTKVTQKTFISGNGQWPFFSSPYSGKGMIIGWLAFDMGNADTPPNGDVTWMKLPVATAKFYAQGFGLEESTESSPYSFSTGAQIFNWNSGQVVLQGGNLSQNITNAFTLGANNKVTGDNNLKLTFTTTTGTFKGSVLNPDTGKFIPISGAVLQNQEQGVGVFSGTNQTGSVLLLSQ